MATASAPRPPPPQPPPKLYDLDVTVVSAKHLKNVNWRNGDLKPYVILWLDPERRLATKPDDSGSTRPVWNERFVLPCTFPPRDCILTLEVFHSKPSETPRPLVGTLSFELRDLIDSDDSSFRLRTLELRRPSGRPHGKIRLKLGLIERPGESYQPPPPPPSGYYYSSAPLPPMPYGGGYYSSPPPPPPPSVSPSRPPNYSYTDSYSGYYSSYYTPQPPPRPYYDAQSGYGGPGGPGPSAPVEYTPYDYHKRNVGRPGVGLVMGTGSGTALETMGGRLGGLSLEEGNHKHEEHKVADRLESDVASTSRNERYGDY